MREDRVSAAVGVIREDLSDVAPICGIIWRSPRARGGVIFENLGFAENEGATGFDRAG